MNLSWWGYVILAGLAWGTYVPIIFYGGTELTTRPGTIGGRLASILCVGIAYFVLAVIIPIVLMATRDDAKPDWKMNGLVFSSLAGVAGAVGAICVIFASKAAVDTAKGEYETHEQALVSRIETEPDSPRKQELQAELEEHRAGRAHYLASYRIYIAPLIFALAPFINTIISLVWHPRPGHAFHFGLDLPTWHLPLGIVLVATGTFLVLYSKEAAEANKAAARPAVTGPSPAAPK